MSRRIISSFCFIVSSLSHYSARFSEIFGGDVQDILIERLVSSQKKWNKALPLIAAFQAAV